ncbi:class I SAM-dependent methyltransferase [Marinobacter sp.]|uniref:class I SAM-dependent methyltransferase n=1 Tax=Marinobacter sp. TaxID=50741 RepID=UPI002B275ADB|nr:class I SAM-dependent methyltransferase [Marinobacter sp.]
MPDHWSMSQCTDCQSIWLNPRPDPLSLPRAYDNYYTHNINSDDLPKNGVKGIAWRLVHGYLNNRFNMNLKPSTGWGYTLFTLIEPWRLKLDYYNRHLTPRNVGKPGKLLDIGCGNGAFLSRAAEMGWQAKGCEIDPKAVSACHSIGLDVLEGDAFCPELKEQSFDVITMSHVIEHVHDQQALLQRTYDLLRPGGWLWLATPNPQSIGKKISGTAWHALHPPYHLCITSQTILIDWLKDKGFTTIHHVRRGSHVRNVWNASQFIARQERIPRLSSASLLCWRIISDCLSTISPKWGEETVLLARKPV